ncbi:MAG: prolipoprotein diacylglyceryl transferase [Chitinophagaceae bacterium]|nr:MAG: prolipoprotein diacylglyceryl transferase [Chitinophagaceae bacterium]
MIFLHRSYATLTDFIYDLTGLYIPLPIYSFGFFVALAIFTCFAFAYFELKRKAKNGEFKYIERKKKDKTLYYLPHQLAANMSMRSVVWGFVGAKLFYLLESPQEIKYIFQDPLLFLTSGLTVYGGIIFGFFSVLFDAKRYKISFWKLADATAPGLMFSYGVGRLGCHVSGDGDWGRVNSHEKPEFFSFLPDWLWAHDYPHNIIDAGKPIEGCVEKHCYVLAEAVYPTPVYEFFICLLLFSLIWWLRKKIFIPGILFGVYLVLNGIERFFIEFIRVNQLYEILWFHLSQAQIISVLLVLSGFVLIFYMVYKKK